MDCPLYHYILVLLPEAGSQGKPEVPRFVNQHGDFQSLHA